MKYDDMYWGFAYMTMETMLIIGHPGHEIRCHGWMARLRPEVHVLTSGGGASRAGRTESTRRTVETAGARCGKLFGDFSDHEIYAFLLGADHTPLVTWTAALAAEIRRQEPRLLVTDMVEGYNSSHDLLAYLVDVAVTHAAAAGAKPTEVRSQPLIGRPDQAWEGRLRPVETLMLNNEEYERKMEAARGYPELSAEVELALLETGAEAFRCEAFYAMPRGEALLDALPSFPPYYETYGEEQVRRGKYSQVIRHREHLKPFVATVRRRLGIG